MISLLIFLIMTSFAGAILLLQDKIIIVAMVALPVWTLVFACMTISMFDLPTHTTSIPPAWYPSIALYS